jgi:cysteine dioxygenase type I
MAKHRSLFSPTAFLTQLAEQRRLWEPLITFDPWSRHYVRLPSGSGVEAWLLTWLPGQGTEWHDHGGSAGAFLPVRGTLTERQAMVQPDEPPRIRPEIRTIGTGMLRPFGTKHVHRVTNEGVEAAVSLHAYAPALVEMNEYAMDGDRLRLVAAQRAGQSW